MNSQDESQSNTSKLRATLIWTASKTSQVPSRRWTAKWIPRRCRHRRLWTVSHYSAWISRSMVLGLLISLLAPRVYQSNPTLETSLSWLIQLSRCIPFGQAWVWCDRPCPSDECWPGNGESFKRCCRHFTSTEAQEGGRKRRYWRRAVSKKIQAQRNGRIRREDGRNVSRESQAQRSKEMCHFTSTLSAWRVAVHHIQDKYPSIQDGSAAGAPILYQRSIQTLTSAHIPKSRQTWRHRTIVPQQYLINVCST